MKRIGLVSAGFLLLFCFFAPTSYAASGEAEAIMRLLVQKGVVTPKESEDFLAELNREREADKVEVKVEVKEELREEGLPLFSGGKFKVYGSVDVVGYLQGNTSFKKKNSVSFAENIARLGMKTAATEQLETDVRITAANTSGDDGPLYGTSTDDVKVVVDVANLTVKDILDTGINVTFGRQEIVVGDGFLVGDGRADSVAQWSLPLKSFDAVRGTWTSDNYTVDLFGAFVDNDWQQWVGTYDAGPPLYQDQLPATSYTGGGELYGTNMHYAGEDMGDWDLGVFFRNDESLLRNDTLALSLRGDYDVPAVPHLNLTGEIVQQLGRTRLRAAELLADDSIRRDALGGHLDATYTFTSARYTPYVSAGYIYLPGDNIKTPGQNEAFDPMFFDGTDWGRWYLGNIVGGQGQIINSNERVMKGEVGLHPTSSTQLRLQFFNIRLDRGLGEDFSLKNYANELNLIFDYWPNEIFYWGAALGYAHPLEAAKYWNADAGTGEQADEDTYEFLVWAGVEF